MNENDAAQIIVSLITLFIFLILYLLPFVIANARHHHNQATIFLTNLFFGWTLLGWLICFIWAFSNPPSVIIREIHHKEN